MPDQPHDPPSLESTAILLRLIRSGDVSARDRLIGRYMPALRRWAHGRLPRHARDLNDTDDLVQITLIRTLEHLKDFEPRHPGAFLGYLRQIFLNKVRDEFRADRSRPDQDELDERIPHGGPSPLESVIGKSNIERYERALQALTDEQREAVIMRLELGFTYPEIAAALDCPTANAARMLVTRGIVRLARLLGGNPVEPGRDPIDTEE